MLGWRCCGIWPARPALLAGYRPHLIDGCLAGTGLTIEPW
jgi:hypothetical protein